MNNKFMRSVLALLLVLVLCLAGCGEKIPEETTAPETTGAAADYSKYPEIDYMSLDLSQYVTLGQYKGMSIEAEKKPEVTDKDVADKITADLIYSGYTEKITDRAVTKEDTVSISFEGFMDGIAFSGGKGSQDNFTIYDGGGFIDGFADGLIGAMPGVEVDVNVVFPENYHSADLAGKPAVFKVTVHHIYGAKELTDEIANAITGGTHKTVAAMTEYYRERLIEENEQEYKDYRADLVWSRIFEGVESNIPDKMVDDLYNYQLYWAEYYASMYGVSVDVFLQSNGDTRESLRAESKNNILTNMVIYHIMKVEGITLSDAEYDQFIADSGRSEADWLKSYTKEELVDIFSYTKTFYSAIDWQSFTEKEAG